NRVPLGLFYLPLIASWIGFAAKYRSLTLPIIANPPHSRGAIWGESKSAYLLDVRGSERRHVAESVAVIRSAGRRTLFADLERVRQLLCGAGLAFPHVAKPDVGRHGACRLDDLTALREYLRHLPSGQRVILQRFMPYPGEAAVLYGLPGAQSGRILSLTFRLNGHWRDAWCHVTPELEARIDAIARSMREFHYGRFHLRFASANDLMRAENFSVVEIRASAAAQRPIAIHACRRRNSTAACSTSTVPHRGSESRARFYAGGMRRRSQVAVSAKPVQPPISGVRLITKSQRATAPAGDRGGAD